MDVAMTRKPDRWVGIACGLAVLAGAGVLAVGVVEPQRQWIFGGAMVCLMAVVAWLRERALLPGRDGTPASNAEKAAWFLIGIGLGATFVTGGIALGPNVSATASYLLFAGCALIVAAFPLYRVRFVEEHRRYREVAEDERDRMIRAQGDYLAKRLVELAAVAFAVAWVLAPQRIASVTAPLQIAALVLLPVLAANMAGEARVALLHWRDRQ